MHKFYFTFCGDSPYHKNYHVIEANHESVARTVMFDRFGGRWAFCYKSAEEAGVERWGLKELKAP